MRYAVLLALLLGACRVQSSAELDELLAVVETRGYFTANEMVRFYPLVSTKDRAPLDASVMSAVYSVVGVYLVDDWIESDVQQRRIVDCLTRFSEVDPFQIIKETSEASAASSVLRSVDWRTAIGMYTYTVCVTHERLFEQKEEPRKKA